jgi:hypothetical protein
MRGMVARCQRLAKRGLVRQEFADKLATLCERLIAGDDKLGPLN